MLARDATPQLRAAPWTAPRIRSGGGHRGRAGNSARSRVPPPGGLSTASAPSSAATRSASPRTPRSRGWHFGAAHAVVGDLDHHQAVRALHADGRGVARAYLATLASASETTKWAAARGRGEPDGRVDLERDGHRRAGRERRAQARALARSAPPDGSRAPARAARQAPSQLGLRAVEQRPASGSVSGAGAAGRAASRARPAATARRRAGRAPAAAAPRRPPRRSGCATPAAPQAARAAPRRDAPRLRSSPRGTRTAGAPRWRRTRRRRSRSRRRPR